MLPTADFYGTQLSRLMLGDNPFNGHSYIEHKVSGDEMMDYYTADKVVETLFEAERQGINAYMALGEPFVLRCIRQYRLEGGKMHVLFQSYPAMDLEVNLHYMLKCEPLGIYHQGGTLDNYLENGAEELVKKRLKLIKDTGVPMGLGTHVPGVIARAEAMDWGVDFYMACLYNARRQQRDQASGFLTGKKKDVLVFYPEDPPVMLDMIRKTPKPCIAFKILAGGQRIANLPSDEVPAEIERAYAEAYMGLKPGDFTCIGVYQAKRNELAENCRIVRKVLGDSPQG